MSFTASRGNFVAGKALLPQSYESLVKTGVNAGLSLKVPGANTACVLSYRKV